MAHPYNKSNEKREQGFLVFFSLPVNLKDGWLFSILFIQTNYSKKIMYAPSSFKENRAEILHNLIRQNNFGILITQNGGKPMATHIPFMIDPDRGKQGTLITHMARANKHWRSWDEKTVAMIIFRGPHSYISPSWYENKVTVPTWNYAAVHLYGRPVLIHEKKRLRKIVTDLVHYHEAQVDSDWSLNQADSIMETELKAIVGIEIPIEKIEGKMKFNQNRSKGDQQRVIDHLSGSGDSMQREVAKIMKRNVSFHGRKPDERDEEG